jgi:hypothetical protein
MKTEVQFIVASDINSLLKHFFATVSIAIF